MSVQVSETPLPHMPLTGHQQYEDLYRARPHKGVLAWATDYLSLRQQ
jgi:hypothetical protein